MRILLTGGHGFVGSHVYERLRDRHTVSTFDSIPKFNGQNVTKYDSVHGEMEGKDMVVHLAGHSGAVGSKENIYGYFSTNSFGTLNVLDAMLEYNVKHIIFASSFSTYGVPRKLPVTEETPLAPNNVYGHSKAVAEELIGSYREEYGITATVLRINMIYGERQTEMNAIQGFVDSALNGRPLLIFGDGRHTREFVYVGDVAECIEKCVRKRPDDTFVVSTERPYTMNEVAETVVEKIPNATIKHIQKTRFNFNSRTDCSKIHNELGWKSKTELPDGIDRVIGWRKSLSSDRV